MLMLKIMYLLIIFLNHDQEAFLRGSYPIIIIEHDQIGSVSQVRQIDRNYPSIYKTRK